MMDTKLKEAQQLCKDLEEAVIESAEECPGECIMIEP